MDKIDFYLGDFQNWDSGYEISEIPESVDQAKARFSSSNNEKPDRLFDNCGLVSELPFYFKGCEANTPEEPYVLTKNRIFSNSGVIVFSVQENRHWSHYYKSPPDIPFSEKKPVAFWRGANTGDKRKYSRRGDFVKLNGGCVDSAWSFKDRKQPRHFLEHKYLVSIEGNDKDSGLNWKLNSNSLVLMPRPRTVSWLMESWLIPYEHFVPLRDDFSDIEEKVSWCESNQSKCREIVKNANEHMDMFSDRQEQVRLEIEVLKKYFKKLSECTNK